MQPLMAANPTKFDVPASGSSLKAQVWSASELRERWQEVLFGVIALYGLGLVVCGPEKWRRWLLFGVATYATAVAFYCGSYARNNKAYKDENEKHRSLNDQQREQNSKLANEVNELRRVENELSRSLEGLKKVEEVMQRWGGQDGDGERIIRTITDCHVRYIQQQDRVSLRRIFEAVCSRKENLEMTEADFELFAKMVQKDKRLKHRYQMVNPKFSQYDENGDHVLDLAEFETLVDALATAEGRECSMYNVSSEVRVKEPIQVPRLCLSSLKKESG